MTDVTQPCRHLQPHTWPLGFDLVLDDHLGPTEALARCRHCDRSYLLEMLDWSSGAQLRLRLMRIARVPAADAAGLLRDLARGSCDVRRAAEEAHYLRNRAVRLAWLLLLDVMEPEIVGLVPAPAERPVPGAPWRELPCDGRWVDYARSYLEMVNDQA